MRRFIYNNHHIIINTTTTTTDAPTTTTTTTSGSVTYSVGDSALGGKIAYILVSGDPRYNANVQHGLVVTAASKDAAPWGCTGVSITSSQFLFQGSGNTLNIVNGCADSGTAARLCYNLSEGGYDDWWLPSNVELQKFYANRALIGDWSATTVYWGSHQYTASSAWGIYGPDLYNLDKTTSYKYRPCRYF